MSQFLETIKSSPWFRRVVWLLVLLLGVWILAWIAVPPLVRAQLEKLGSEALGRALTVEKVEFLPWSLELTLRGVTMATKDGKDAQFQVERIYMDAELQSLWRVAPVIDALQVDNPVIRITQLAPGRYDVDDLLALSQQEAQPGDAFKASMRFALFNIALRGGAVDFDDRTVGVAHSLRKVRLDVPFLSSFSADREVKVAPHLAFELNGSAFETSASATPFALDRRAEVHLHVEDFDLQPFGRYLPADVPMRLQAGRLGGDLQVGFEQLETPRVLLSGNLQLRGVQITDPQEQPLVAVDGLQVVLKEFEPLQRRVLVDALDWQGVRVHVRRDAAGRWNLPGLAQPTQDPRTRGAQPKAQIPGAPWHVQVAKVRLQDGSVHWADARLPGGAAAWDVGDLQLELASLALPLAEPMRLRASASLKQSGGNARGEAARLAVQGAWGAGQGQAAVSIRALPLAMAAPYLGSVLKPRVEGLVNADVGVAMRGDIAVAKVATLSVDKLWVRCAPEERCPTLYSAGVKEARPDSLAEWERLEVGNAWVHWPQRTATLDKVSLRGPRLLLSRSASGGWMFEQWGGASHEGAAPSESTDTPVRPWSIGVGALEVVGAGVAWRDEAASGPVALNVLDVQVHARDFSFAEGRMAPTALRLDGRVSAGRTEPGRVRYEGTVAMAPALTVQGRVLAQHLPLHALEPYVAQDLNVDIVRADGSFDGNVRYAQGPAGAAVAVNGDASLDEVRVRAKAGRVASEDMDRGGPRVGVRGEELLRWKSLALRGVTMSTQADQPLALEVKQTALSDFFARIIVQENGRINLQDIRKGAAADDAAAAAHASAHAPPSNSPGPMIRFGPVALTNGSVRFTDYFIKPNYSADLSALTGRLSGFSSAAPPAEAESQMAELEVRGRAQGTASLEVTGRVNPLVKPLVLDIQGRMRDLELPPLSPYSIKYAGHGIERGKLSMDVSYKILPDGQLTASNKLVLNQLAFGDPVEGAPASLPVRLATALLADRNGVINVDLPISGSLNDPEFRLGAVVLKVIGNLIMKAITAPFSLLTGAFSDGGEQGAVGFALGSAELDGKAQEQLDHIARELNNRPALKVTVVGWAQSAVELPAWKRLRLQEMVMAQKRRAAIRAGLPADGVLPVTDAEYPSLLKELYRRADIRKPRNFVGLAKDLPVSEMEALLMQSIVVPEGAMADLALARGVAVRDYLAQKQVALDRLFVGASKVQPGDASNSSWQPKAELALAVQ